MKFVKKASGIALAAMLAAGLTAGCGGGGGEKKAADAGKEIVVGVNAELTGNVANYGKSMLSGFELAVEEANKAGGVAGKQIKVVTRPGYQRLCGCGRTRADGKQDSFDCSLRDGAWHYLTKRRKDETFRFPRMLHRSLSGRYHGTVCCQRSES